MSLIHTSSLPDVDIPEMSITDYVFHKASAYPDRIAISDGAGNQYTFAELEQASRSLAGGLAARGMGLGTCIALMAPNLPQFPVVFHGVATAGATLTTINPTYGAAEVRHQLQDAGATMLITIGMFLEVAQEAVEGTDVTEVVTIDAADGSLPLVSLMGDPIPQVEVDVRDHVMALPYSSGTTGLPKGVMLTTTTWWRTLRRWSTCSSTPTTRSAFPLCRSSTSTACRS